MKSVFIDDFTMVINTYNRPRMLATALENYVESGFAFQIVVVDSSSELVQSQNAARIDRMSPLIKHVCYSAERMHTKSFELPTFVETAFGMYATDDDVVLLDGAVACLRFLQENPDYVACHGVYYNARLAESDLRVGVAWASISIDLERPLDRIFALCQRYQPIFFCVQKRETLLAARTPIEMKSPHFVELYNAFRMLIEGKVAALPIPFMVRNEQLERGLDFYCDPNNWIMRDSGGMSVEFVQFRDILAKDLEPFVSGRSAAHSIELAYIAYFIHALRVNTMLTRLESEGDLLRGSAANLIGRSTIANIAPDPPESVDSVLRSFMNGGWPQFG